MKQCNWCLLPGRDQNLEASRRVTRLRNPVLPTGVGVSNKHVQLRERKVETIASGVGRKVAMILTKVFVMLEGQYSSLHPPTVVYLHNDVNKLFCNEPRKYEQIGPHRKKIVGLG